MKEKKGMTNTNVFKKILDECKRRPNKIWVKKGCEFYNRCKKKWFEKDAIEMYSTHNEGNLAEIFIRTLKKKVY